MDGRSGLDAQTREVIQDEWAIQEWSQDRLFVTHPSARPCTSPNGWWDYVRPRADKAGFTSKMTEVRERFAPEFTHTRARSHIVKKKWQGTQ